MTWNGVIFLILAGKGSSQIDWNPRAGPDEVSGVSALCWALCFSCVGGALSGTKIASQNRNDHGGRRQARNHFAAEIAGFSASPAAKKSLAASDFGMRPQLAFKIAGKSPVLKGRDFLHLILPSSYRSQTSSWSQLSHFQAQYRFSRDQYCHFIVKRILVGKVGKPAWGMDTNLSGVSLSELQIFWILHSMSIHFQGSLHECEQVCQERHDTQTHLWPQISGKDHLGDTWHMQGIYSKKGAGNFGCVLAHAFFSHGVSEIFWNLSFSSGII